MWDSYVMRRGYADTFYGGESGSKTLLTEEIKYVAYFRGVMKDLYQYHLSSPFIQEILVNHDILCLELVGWLLRQRKGSWKHYIPTKQLTPDIGTKSLSIEDFINKRTSELGMDMETQGINKDCAID
jgi:hypothetical protein